MINFSFKRRGKNVASHARHRSDKVRGFTLFVAVLVSSLVLAIGFSIGSIALKQLMISGSGGGSLVAFYAADSAIECATYWDRKNAAGDLWDQSPFGTSTPDTADFDPNGTGLCGSEGHLYNWTKTCDNSPTCDASSLAATTTFAIDFGDPLDEKYAACAYVAVGKSTDAVTGEESTNIIARGYNTNLITASGECNLEKQRVVERGLLQSY